MKVCVIGLGYIGLPTAALIASKKINVLGVDISKHAVDKINKGEIHIVEPELDMLVAESVKSGYLRASLSPEEADVFIIAVPTPFKQDNNIKNPDLSYIESAVNAILPHLRDGNLVILESTSPVNTTDQLIAKRISDAGFDITSEIYIAYCPERVLPGKIVKELEENDRIIGGLNSASADKAYTFYKQFVKGDCKKTNSRTAEMVKLVENSYRDVNIAFANELSMICDEADINVNELIDLANLHPRVNILEPGPGVGGHCIAVDPWFLVHTFPEKSRIIKSARIVNDSKPLFVIDLIKKAANGIKKPKIACFGLTYKPNIDDIRESPSLAIVNQLAVIYSEKDLLIVDPFVSNNKLNMVSIDSAIENADILVFLVKHDQFKMIDKQKFMNKITIDTCGLMNT